MIEITKEKIGDEEFNVFTVLSDGFVPSGHVEMTCRVSDMKCEGSAFFIDVSDQDVSKNGDYSPLTMSKQELKVFINFLNDSYDSMND